MPAIPQERIRGQSRPPLLVMWNWAQKPLENLLCGLKISEAHLPLSTASNLPAAHGQHWEGGMTGPDSLPLSPCCPLQIQKGCGTLNSADLARCCRRLSRTVYSTVGLISLLTTRSALGPCQHIPEGP